MVASSGVRRGALGDVAIGLGVTTVTGGTSVAGTAVDAVSGCVSGGRDKVAELEVGRLRDVASRSAGDGLTPDHVPSLGAIRKAVEDGTGREFDPGTKHALFATTPTAL